MNESSSKRAMNVRCLLSAGLLCVACVAGLAQDRYEYHAVPTGERQLFLDDFLLGDVYNVQRIIHQPAKYEGNPVIRADQPWEGSSIQIRSAPVWDPQDERYKLWYFGPHATGSPLPRTAFIGRSPCWDCASGKARRGII